MTFPFKSRFSFRVFEIGAAALQLDAISCHCCGSCSYRSDALWASTLQQLVELIKDAVNIDDEHPEFPVQFTTTASTKHQQQQQQLQLLYKYHYNYGTNIINVQVNVERGSRSQRSSPERLRPAIPFRVPISPSRNFTANI
jgi:hypothetical protein